MHRPYRTGLAERLAPSRSASTAAISALVASLNPPDGRHGLRERAGPFHPHVSHASQGGPPREHRLRPRGSGHPGHFVKDEDDDDRRERHGVIEIGGGSLTIHAFG